MYYSNEKKPKIGEEVIFIYDDTYHIGYLVSDNGSDKPRKWTWYSYLKGYEVIEDIIEEWFELPTSQPERSKREDAFEECKELGHVNTWMPKNQTLCMRCGALNSMET